MQSGESIPRGCYVGRTRCPPCLPQILQHLRLPPLLARDSVNAGRGTAIKVRQVKYLNNVVEQDHRAIKRIIRPTPRRKCPWGMPGFKDFRCARVILSSIEMHMISKGQMKHTGKIKPFSACQFYSLMI